MKAALFLSGQPRAAVWNASRINDYLIKNNNIDVFLHAWYDPKDLNFYQRDPNHFGKSADIDLDKRLIEIYNPKKYIFDVPKYWFNNNMYCTEENIKQCFSYGLNDPKGIDYFSRHIVNSSHSQWYSNFKVNTLCEEYCIENNIKYDVIIKLRYDVSPTKHIDLDSITINTNTIYYQDLNQPLDMVSDWFAMGTQPTMSKWCLLYFFIEDMFYKSMKKHQIWCNELLVKEYLQHQNINKEKIDWGVTF